MSFLDRVQPRDVVALFVLAGGFILKCYGINTHLDTLMALIVGYYFSKRVYEESNRK